MKALTEKQELFLHKVCTIFTKYNLDNYNFMHEGKPHVLNKDNLVKIINKGYYDNDWDMVFIEAAIKLYKHVNNVPTNR